MSAADAPPLVALFVVTFDQKIGYVSMYVNLEPFADAHQIHYNVARVESRR